MRTRWALTVVMVALVLPAPAQAGVVTSDPEGSGVLEYVDVAGQANGVVVTWSAGAMRITDTAPVVVTPAAGGCTAAGLHAAVCPPQYLAAFLGLGADRFDGRGDVKAEVHGGPGNDSLSTVAEADWATYPRLWGDAGNDVLTGSAGTAWLYGGPGADRMSGGAGGGDEVFYRDVRVDDRAGVGLPDTSPRATGVTVSLDGVADDGAAGEGDDVAADVEAVDGTGLSDTLIGNGAPNRFVAGAGDDRFEGNGGEDELWGEGGNDTLVGGAGADNIQGGLGDDDLDAVDGGGDTVRCGAGVDAAHADYSADYESLTYDPITGERGSDCERSTFE